MTDEGIHLYRYHCQCPVCIETRRDGWNAALDEAAARIGEIKAFGTATQDSFAVYIKGLKR